MDDSRIESRKIACKRGVLSFLYCHLSDDSLTAPPKLQEIVRSADEFPLLGACFEASAHETSDAAVVFDLAENRFDGLAPFLVQRSAPLGRELALHPLGQGQALRYPAPGRR